MVESQHAQHDPAWLNADADQQGWREEGKDLLRAAAAGSIVGMPLLYTMEMWWRGLTLSPERLLMLLGATLLVNFGFCLFSGFRKQQSVFEAAAESMTSVGLGMVFSLGVLLLIGEVRFETGWWDVLGRVMIETGPVSLGISFANSQVGEKSRNGGEAAEEKDDGHKRDLPASRRQLKQDLKDLAATIGGATVFTYNIAPTEEVLMISTRLSALQHLLVMGVSLVLCYMILFAAGFKRQQVHVESLFQSPTAESVMAYATALFVAFVLLFLVGVPEVTSGPMTLVGAAVTLGLPAAVGASAGRLIV